MTGGYVIHICAVKKRISDAMQVRFRVPQAIISVRPREQMSDNFDEATDMAREKQGDPGIADRLRQMVKQHYTSREQAAQECGVSPQQMNRYLTAWNQPMFVTVAKLCRRARVRMEWIACGTGPMQEPAPGDGPRPFDPSAMVAIIEAVEEGLSEIRKKLTPQQKAQLVVSLYELYADSAVKPDRRRVLQLMKATA